MNGRSPKLVSTVDFHNFMERVDINAMYICTVAKISVTSPIVINMPTRELLAGETKNSFVSRFEHLNNRNNVCKQISSLMCRNNLKQK